MVVRGYEHGDSRHGLGAWGAGQLSVFSMGRVQGLFHNYQPAPVLTVSVNPLLREIVAVALEVGVFARRPAVTSDADVVQ